jgi:hypothetical protein
MAPNIVNVSAIYGKTVGAALGTSSADILTNSSGSGKVFKINAIYISNIDIDGSGNAEATVTWYDASATTSYNLAKTVVVPADATLVVVDKDAQIYLEEGDKIAALAGTSGDLEIVISYEDIS